MESHSNLPTQPQKRVIETREEREIRINALALVAKIDPLLGKFYASPDLTSDAIAANLSQINIRRLNEAYNNLRQKKEIDDKQKQIIAGVVRAMLILNLKPVKDFLGDVKFDSFITLLAQSFVDTYGSSFKIPEKEEKAEVDEDLLNGGKEKKEGEEDTTKSSGDSSSDDSDSSGDDSEEDEDADSEDEEEVSDEEDSDDESDTDSEDEEGAEDEADDLESESSAKPTKTITYTDAQTFITYDLIAFLRAMDWNEISKSLIQLRNAEGFKSEASVIATKRITFRKARKLRNHSEDLCYLYEIVLNGKAVGLIHSTEESGNSPRKRLWRVSLRDHFNDAKYRTGYSATEPYTVINSQGRLVLHNLNVMTMDEARSWVKTALEV